MPCAAIVAAALTDHSARTWQLLVDGLDVSSEPGSKRYWTLIDSIAVTVAGPGGVSSMDFTVRDPQLRVAFVGGEPVVMSRADNGAPDNLTDRAFLGIVTRVRTRPMRGQVGRDWLLTCDGIEKILDDTVTTQALTFSAATTMYAMIQAIVGVASGLGELRALVDTVNSLGSDPLPIGRMGEMDNTDAATLAVIPVTIPAGTAVREAINMAAAGCARNLSMTYNDAVMITVDFSLGLRAWLRGLVPIGPIGSRAVPFLGPPDTIPEDMTFDIDAGSVLRAVYVKGTGASAYVTDGTGKRGRITTLADDSLTTTAACQAAGAALIQQYRAQLRGSFSVSDAAWNAACGRTPLHAVVITNTALGLAGVTYAIGQADSTFHGDKGGFYSATKVYFGGGAPSAAALVRRLTRDTLS